MKLTLGVVTLWLSIIVILPLLALGVGSLEDGPAGFVDALDGSAARSALAVTVGVSVAVL